MKEEKQHEIILEGGPGVPGVYRIENRGEVQEIHDELNLDWITAFRPNPLLGGNTFRYQLS